MNDARYDVLTWDADQNGWTPQDGLENESQGVDIHGLRRVLRELRGFGYSCHRVRESDGTYDSDPSVLVERVDS